MVSIVNHDLFFQDFPIFSIFWKVFFGNFGSFPLESPREVADLAGAKAGEFGLDGAKLMMYLRPTSPSEGGVSWEKKRNVMMFLKDRFQKPWF